MSKSNHQDSSNPIGSSFPAELRQRLSDGLHLNGKARRTHDAYIRAVRQLSGFAQCNPDKVDEAPHLQVGDIDAARGLVHVHRGKGAKDRYTPLPTTTLKLLRAYWVTPRHQRLLFPADGRNHRRAKHGVSQARTTMSETAVQGALKVCLDEAKRPSNQRRKQMMRPYPRRRSLSPIIKRPLSRRL